MAIRLFRCGSCRHRMRMGGMECGRCGVPKPFLQTDAPYKVMLFMLLLALSGTIMTVAMAGRVGVS